MVPFVVVSAGIEALPVLNPVGPVPRDLPHTLVASFKATLEEARQADLLLHVVDASSPVFDTDGDGIPDVDDACPTLPEDYDGFQDSDGCPDGGNVCLPDLTIFWRIVSSEELRFVVFVIGNLRRKSFCPT